MLKLAVGDSSFTFAFTGDLAIANRDSIKDQIALAIAKNNGSNSASLATPLQKRVGLTALDVQARQSLLARDKALAQLHKGLVMTGIISEEEFWQRRKVFDSLNVVTNENLQYVD